MGEEGGGGGRRGARGGRIPSSVARDGPRWYLGVHTASLSLALPTSHAHTHASSYPRALRSFTYPCSRMCALPGNYPHPHTRCLSFSSRACSPVLVRPRVRARSQARLSLSLSFSLSLSLSRSRSLSLSLSLSLFSSRALPYVSCQSITSQGWDVLVFGVGRSRMVRPMGGVTHVRRPPPRREVGMGGVGRRRGGEEDRKETRQRRACGRGGIVFVVGAGSGS